MAEVLISREIFAEIPSRIKKLYCEVRDPLGSSWGLGRDGGMAEYPVAPMRCVVPVSWIDPADAAPFTDAGLTSYHAVKQVLPALQPSTIAVVIGLGGLGHLLVCHRPTERRHH